MNLGEDIQLYPNSMSGIVNISTANKIAKVEVYGINGKRLLWQNISSTIDVSNF